ncbi:MAG: hypothetical protein KF817_05225 [Phycisphaeraceae bacterium]|nr:hypothetical protein [Phycisphaeraceae bacterium]
MLSLSAAVAIALRPVSLDCETVRDDRFMLDSAWDAGVIEYERLGHRRIEVAVARAGRLIDRDRTDVDPRGERAAGEEMLRDAASEIRDLRLFMQSRPPVGLYVSTTDSFGVPFPFLRGTWIADDDRDQAVLQVVGAGWIVGQHGQVSADGRHLPCRVLGARILVLPFLASWAIWCVVIAGTRAAIGSMLHVDMTWRGRVWNVVKYVMLTVLVTLLSAWIPAVLSTTRPGGYRLVETAALSRSARQPLELRQVLFAESAVETYCQYLDAPPGFTSGPAPEIGTSLPWSMRAAGTLAARTARPGEQVIVRAWGWPFRALATVLVSGEVDSDTLVYELRWGLSWRRGMTTAGSASCPGHAALPLRPLPIGFMGNWLVFATGPGLVMYLLFWRRRRHRLARGECLFCGYPAGRGDVCSECGRPAPGARRRLTA